MSVKLAGKEEEEERFAWCGDAEEEEVVEVEEEEEDMAEVVMAVEDIEWVLVDLTIELDQHSLLPNE